MISDRASRNSHFRGGWRQGFVTELRLAVGFLTVFPVMPDCSIPEQHAASFALFPLAGFAIGALLCIEEFLLAHVLGVALRSALIVLTLTIITGGLHLDALADTADALGAGRDRVRALQILRDSRIGAFGAAAIFFAIVLKIIALASAAEVNRYIMIFAAPGLSRWAMVAVCEGSDYLRANGAGTTLLRNRTGGSFVLASCTAAIIVAAIMSRRLWCGAAAAAIITALMRWFYRRWLG
ncbi:MAG: adenosylcobinamide-GDP ribazoletransferase, partial [Candidatus Binataceae bacterium]